MPDNLNVKYVGTKIMRSRMDFTHYDGKFKGSCRQTLTLRVPLDLSSGAPVYFDMEVTIGEESAPLYINALIRSAFDVVGKDLKTLPEEDQLYCRREGIRQAREKMDELTKLHVGQTIKIPDPGDPEQA